MRFSSSVDALTLTSGRHMSGAPFATTVGRFCAGYAKCFENPVEPLPAAVQGYRGWRLPSFFWGERDDGCMIVATSVAAELAMGHYWDVSLRATRVDIQVTVDLGIDPTVACIEARDTVEQHFQKNPHRARKVTCYDGRGSGYTVYVGAPKSDRRIRIYDKQRESEDEAYANCTRFEVQLRGQRATEYFHRLGVGRDYDASRVEGFVRAELALVGVRLPDHADVAKAVAIPANARTNNARRERWLTEQVRPAIETMLVSGYSESEIMAMLGLGGLTNVPERSTLKLRLSHLQEHTGI